MRTTRLAGATLVVLFAVGGAASAASIDVSMVLSQYSTPNGGLVLVFSGAVSSGAANEVVDVLGQDCGTRSFRLIQGTHTRTGGAWRVENPKQEYPWGYTPVQSGTTFKARRSGQVSRASVWRVKAPVSAVKLKKRRAWRVSTSPPTAFVSMKGKLVVLQRLRGGRWVEIRRKRLAHKPRLEYGGAFNHEAVFEIPQRGWTVRALLPTKSAAPCYLAGVTEQWRT